ncbi:MAG TPA: DUF4199 domain-containing protein [Chitinophagaceae bacterium]|jgi:uncharacterized membrane protein|nr:DUF4199 domain-containing protein [Chitinophagaceae bacterium]
METTKKPTSHILPGLITGVVGIILVVVYYYTGFIFESSAISLVPHIVTVCLIAFFTIKFAKDNHNRLNFGSLFGYGFRTTIVFTLVMAAFMFFMINIFPEYKAKYMAILTERLNAQTDILPEKKQTFISGTSEYFRSIIIGYNLFINVIAGTVGALVGATLARKSPPASVDQKV